MPVPHFIILLILLSLTNTKADKYGSFNNPSTEDSEEQNPNFNRNENREVQNSENSKESRKETNSNSKEREEKKKSSENSESTKLPMNCIQDYAKYCKKKFIGYKFNDGCHKCKCKRNKRNYCSKGPCLYYVKSFEEAADYCQKINKSNEKSYQKQKAQRKTVRSININRVNASNAKDLQNKKTIIKKRIMKVKLNKTNSNLFDTELKKLMKSSNDNLFDRKLDKGVNSKLPLDADFTKSISKKGKRPSLNNENNVEKLNKKEGTKDKTEIRKENEMAAFQSKVLDSLKSFPKNVSKLFSKTFKIPPNNLKINKNLVRLSLSKMSKQNIIKAMIYQLAWNELTIDRIKKSWKKKHLTGKGRRHIFNRLMKIKKSNSKYKMKILAVVKNEMIRNKLHQSPALIDKKNMKFFKKTLRNLVKLNKFLQEIKSSKYTNKRVHRRYRRRHYGGTENIKISFIITFLSVCFVMILFNY